VAWILLRLLGVEKKNDEQRVQPKYVTDVEEDVEAPEIDCGSPLSSIGKDDATSVKYNESTSFMSVLPSATGSPVSSRGKEGAAEGKRDASSSLLSVGASAETIEKPIVEPSPQSPKSSGTPHKSMEKASLGPALDSPATDPPPTACEPAEKLNTTQDLEERQLQEGGRRRLVEEEEKKRVAEENAAKKEAERREAERKREEELRPFGPSDRVREMLEKRETKLKLEPAAPDKVVPASPRTKPKEMVVDQDISLEKEFQSGKRGSSVSSSREQLRATTANFQKVLNEVASAPAGSEALAFWSRRARVDTTFFHQVLDEIAPAGRDEESHIGAAASSGLQRSNSWHARQCRSADSSEPPTSPSILLKARSGLMRTKTFEREPEQTTSKQMVTPEKGVERGQSKDMQSTWEEDVAARGKLLRVSTARFNSLLDQVIQAPPGSKELQAAAEKARMEADEFHHILDQVAPAADADAQQAITVGPTSPRSPQRKRSWPPASDPASPSKSSQQRRQQLVQHLRTR